MEKLKNYKGTVKLAAGIIQRDNGDFALVEANAVQTREDGTRLDEELEILKESMSTPTGNIRDGEAEGSVNTINSEAISENGFAEGFETQAGGKAFKIDEFNYENKTYVLKEVTGLDTTMSCIAHLGGEAGSVISKIISIDGNTITVDTCENKAFDAERAYLIIIEHPELGDMILGTGAHAEGYSTLAHAIGAHAEGYNTKAVGKYGHAEGNSTIAGYAAHSEGRYSKATGVESHAEGFDTLATGLSSHAEGRNTAAKGIAAHAEGFNTLAQSDFQHVGGRWNVIDYNNKYVEIIGNGPDGNNRSNAYALDWEGNGYYSGNVYANGNATEGNKLITRDELNIALSETGNYSWNYVQDVVRRGFAPEIFPIGTQFTVHHDEYGDLLFDVVAHDYLKSVDDENAHTMTLLAHNTIGLWDYEVDAVEKTSIIGIYQSPYDGTIYPPVEVSETIPAGTKCWFDYRGGAGYDEYVGKCFTLTAYVQKGWYATLDPYGTDIWFYDNDKLEGTPLCVLSKIYIDDSSFDPGCENYQEIITTYTQIEAGVTYEQHNDYSRTISGSNNYGESSIRQFLNSTSEGGNWWTAQTPFDNPPSYAKKNGFLYGIDKNFLDVVGTVNVYCSGNDKYEYIDYFENTQKPIQYTVQDKFYLPSVKEITGHTQGSSIDDGTTRLPYYQGASITDMIKYDNKNNAAWWILRTPHNNTINVKHIKSDGEAGSRLAIDKSAFAPMCTIV